MCDALAYNFVASSDTYAISLSCTLENISLLQLSLKIKDFTL